MRLRAGAVIGLVITAFVAAAAPADAPTAESNRAQAEREAASLLAALQLPEGATRLDGEPAGDGGRLVTSGVQYAGTSQLVDEVEWWRVPAAPKQVLAYTDAHVPPGAKLVISSGSDPRPAKKFAVGLRLSNRAKSW